MSSATVSFVVTEQICKDGAIRVNINKKILTNWDNYSILVIYNIVLQ